MHHGGRARSQLRALALSRAIARWRVVGARRPGRGAAAAETAAVLPLLVAVVLALIWLISLAATQIRVVDAARETARVAARQDDDTTAITAGRRVAPGAAQIQVVRGAGDVTVSVSARVTGPGGLLAFLPSPTLHAEAVTVTESQ